MAGQATTCITFIYTLYTLPILWLSFTSLTCTMFICVLFVWAIWMDVLYMYRVHVHVHVHVHVMVEYPCLSGERCHLPCINFKDSARPAELPRWLSWYSICLERRTLRSSSFSLEKELSSGVVACICLVSDYSCRRERAVRLKLASRKGSKSTSYLSICWWMKIFTVFYLWHYMYKYKYMYSHK